MIPPRSILLISLLSLCAAPAGAQVLHTFESQERTGRFGDDVAGLGDVDGDGFSDLLVGISNANVVEESGSARVFSGQTGAPLYLYTGSLGDRFGHSVTALGDLNFDGRGDFAVGAPEISMLQPDAGYATVYSGIDGGLLFTHLGDAVDDQFGYSVGGAGDVSGDGVPDLVVGAPQGLDAYGVTTGYARVLSGADHSTVRTLNGTYPGGGFGTAVAIAGDVNDDGQDDVIVGSPRNEAHGDDAGLVQVFSGFDGSILYSLLGNEWELFGSSVTGLGDIDNDGFDDFAAGAPFSQVALAPNVPGVVRVYSGFNGSLLFELEGTEDEDFFGGAVAGTGDVNGDGVPDLVVGASQAGPTGKLFRGRMRVYSGADGSLLTNHHGDAAADFFGGAVDGAGDVNADGFADVIGGAVAVGGVSSTEFGYARVFGGGPRPVVGPPVPGIAGEENTLTVTGATPGTDVVFYGGFQLGMAEVNCKRGSVPLVFSPAKNVGFVAADGAGIAELTRNTRLNLAGRTIYVQVFEFQTCRFSEPVGYTFP